MAEFTLVTKPISPKSAMLRLTGSIGLANIPSLEERLDGLVSVGMIGIGVDLGEVESVASSALGVFVNTAQILGQKNGSLFLVRSRPNLVDLIELLGLQELLRLVADPDQANKELTAFQ
ncbi:MAG: STAS domain-containing protein [Planctomycetota bacterium]|jgi:anti-anti-sigma factor|nr:STAS domain-containing protein [Planctomycetota bacterium]